MLSIEPDKDDKQKMQELFPQLTESQLDAAADNFERYIALAVRVFNRIRNDPAAYARFKSLTEASDRSTMNERSETNRDEDPRLKS